MMLLIRRVGGGGCLATLVVIAVGSAIAGSNGWGAVLGTLAVLLGVKFALQFFSDQAARDAGRATSRAQPPPPDDESQGPEDDPDWSPPPDDGPRPQSYWSDRR